MNARILKQADGKVRCGGCGTAFDARFFLTETRPAAGRTKTALDAPRFPSDESADLLKKLDELAGDDVRLEDTGVEWRLLSGDGENFDGDEDSDIFDALETPVDAELSADAGAARIDELLEDSPGEVDEFLTATPSRVEASEVFSEREDASGANGKDADVDGTNGESDSDAGLAFGDPEDWGELLDETVFDETIARESTKSAAGTASHESDDESLDDRDDIPELPVPDPVTGELSIDQQIDVDLLDVAREDEDGFTSTIAADEKPFGSEDSWGLKKTSPGIETIIMEGDTVRTVLDRESADSAAGTNDDAGESGFLELAKRSVRGPLEALEESDHRRSVFGIAGIAALSVLLAGQLLHQSRAELATIPAFRNMLGPLYRAVGAPITPDWDVSGWRFEVTRGNTGPAAGASGQGNGGDPNTGTAAGANTLTIYSRVGNTTTRPLPYPVINVALTDRFDAIIGSKAVEPREYLPAGADADRLVPAGGTFDAVIAIQSPATDATGFKLNVCYRRADAMLRCAVEDFR